MLSAFLYHNPLTALWAKAELAIQDLKPGPDGAGNFGYIYSSPEHSAEFLKFLTHVFHLYPEAAFHAAIADVSSQKSLDREVYQDLKSRLNELKPFLGDLTYALPALRKQKAEMTRQTLELLGSRRTFRDCLEVGSTGRYISHTRDFLELSGEVYLMHSAPPSYSVVDVMERGQIFKLGRFIPLDDYRVQTHAVLKPASLDFITVYIGFHHCPLALRDSFIGGLAEALRPGGVMIVRDHDAKTEALRRIVALAHDVFNLGTGQPWSVNAEELRNFYALSELETLLAKFGFKSDGRKILQAGDPTYNTLMIFEKPKGLSARAPRRKERLQV